jgi:endo-1,4-beta-mannosidase
MILCRFTTCFVQACEHFIVFVLISFAELADHFQNQNISIPYARHYCSKKTSTIEILYTYVKHLLKSFSEEQAILCDV